VTPIAIVDDYAPFRNYLSDALENLPNGFKVYQYIDGRDFVERFPNENYTPAIVLMDICMERMNGYDTTAWIKKGYPSIPVLAFSDVKYADAIVQLVKCGADGHCSKDDCYPPVCLLKPMEQVMQGKTYYKDPEMVDFIKKRLAMPRKECEVGEESLTELHWKVIRFICLHKSYEEKAAELFIAPDTYKSRLKNIFKKLGLKSSSELYDWAVKRGFIKK